ncbi:MAG TPA: hypothetical protein VHW05_13370 [Phenylobacterium sp.]|jgi:hypothetical protein|nr:hypothetical protein [Phenylobacterium sp.]
MKVLCGRALVFVFVGLSGCAGFNPASYKLPAGYSDLAQAPPEMNDVTSSRRLTKTLPATSVDKQTPAFDYVQQVIGALDDQAGQINGSRQVVSYGGAVGGLGTAISSAAKASSGVTTAFGGLTGILNGVDSAAGLDSRSQIISKAQAAIACVQQAEVLLATPVVATGSPPVNLKMLDTHIDQSLSAKLAVQGSLANDEVYGRFVLASVARLKVANSERNEALLANLGYATGADGQLPWFLVREGWTIWHTAQQQLQAAAGNLSDILAGAKSAISSQANQASGSAKSVAAKSNAVTTQSAVIAMLARSTSGGQTFVTTEDLAGTGTGTDPGQAADTLFQQLQATIAKCPAQSTPTTTAKPSA